MPDDNQQRKTGKPVRYRNGQECHCDECLGIMPAAQPANTDDRPAETIPADLRDYYADIKRRSNGYRSAEMEIVERTGRAETRIEVLEAALGDTLTIAEADGWHSATTGRQIVYRAGRAALAAPSGEKEKV